MDNSFFKGVGIKEKKVLALQATKGRAVLVVPSCQSCILKYQGNETRDLEDGDSGADKHPHRIGYFDWRDELHVSSYELILNDNLYPNLETTTWTTFDNMDNSFF